MRHLAAYLLLVAGGNEKPTKDDVSKLLSSVGIETDDERLSILVGELEGKDVNELIALGKEKLCASGGAPSGAAAAPAAAASGGEAPVKEEKAAKPKEEEVDALDGGMDMFGGGGGGKGDY